MSATEICLGSLTLVDDADEVPCQGRVYREAVCATCCRTLGVQHVRGKWMLPRHAALTKPEARAILLSIVGDAIPYLPKNQADFAEQIFRQVAGTSSAEYQEAMRRTRERLLKSIKKDEENR